MPSADTIVDRCSFNVEQTPVCRLTLSQDTFDMYMCLHIYTYMCIYIYILYTHVYTYVYIYIYIHAYCSVLYYVILHVVVIMNIVITTITITMFNIIMIIIITIDGKVIGRFLHREPCCHTPGLHYKISVFSDPAPGTS